MALPRLQDWELEEGRGALFQAGSGVIEILGRPSHLEPLEWDERHDYQGPEHKLEMTFLVPSAEAVYEELVFRDRNIPGGLRKEPGGNLVFATHDPDGVRLVFRELAR